MALKQATTRIEDDEYELFRATTRALGTTPADALRMFIYAFNEHRGFPYDVRTSKPTLEAFETEEDATRFATELALGVADAAG
ncbi:type II toxin-antitoxin system RelB/DinJ family antitoxin [Actinomyces slackii]|uniref:Addiction module antitoxin, RelB/DinJ family n=1 Tax=Actinomyces slackii TaxID=52774 RepID=A0A3S5EME0_9ACTO|nr:translation repressor RelB [Actinomyces slackii]VEG75950.1 Uncharacterised protein [Actinomyces slackii]